MSLKTAIVQPEGETIPRRNPSHLNKLLSHPSDGSTTLYDILVSSSKTHASLEAMGTRKLLKTHVETKIVVQMVEGEEKEVEKQWTFFEMGPYEFTTFGQYFERVVQIGRGLRELGMGRGDRVHVFAATSANWLTVAHGAVTQSMPIVTSYATLGTEGLETSLV